MKQAFKYSFLVLAFLLSFQVQAQKAVLVVNAPDSLSFIVEANEVAINDDWATSVQFGPVPAKRYNLSFEFPSSNYPDLSTSILLADNKESTYRLKAKTNPEGITTIVLSLVGEAPLSLASPQPTPQDETEVEIALESDTLVVDSLAPLPRPGCGSPPTDMEFSTFCDDYHTISFQFQKIEAAQDLIDNYCLTVQQVSTLMEALDFDDQKYDLAEYASKRVYNPEQLVSISSSFHMELMKKRWMKLIQSK